MSSENTLETQNNKITEMSSQMKCMIAWENSVQNDRLREKVSRCLNTPLEGHSIVDYPVVRPHHSRKNYYSPKRSEKYEAT